MKAILYAGLPRLIIENLNSIKLSSEGDSKLFFAFWENNQPDFNRISNANYKKQLNDTLKVINTNFTNAFVKYINPRDYLWEKNLDESSYNEIQGYRIALLQYDALQQCFNFAKEVLLQEKYNYTWYRSRGDLLINEQLNHKFDGCDLLIPGIHYKTGYCDYYAAGNYIGMESYCNHIETMLDLINLNIYLPVEMTLAMHLSRNKIKVRIDRKLPKILIKSTKYGLKRRNLYYKENTQSLALHPGQVLSTNLKSESNIKSIYRLIYYLFIDFFTLIYQLKRYLKVHVFNIIKRSHK